MHDNEDFSIILHSLTKHIMNMIIFNRQRFRLSARRVRNERHREEATNARRVTKRMWHLALLFLLLSGCLNTYAQDDYYVRQARSLQNDAESYVRQAQQHDRDVDYYMREATGHLRDAEYYQRQKRYAQAESSMRNAQNAIEKAESSQARANTARSNAKSCMRRAREALQRAK